MVSYYCSMPVSLVIHDETLLLFPDRYIYWPAQQVLIMSDIHLGKVSHFRKNGIAVPSGVITKELERFRQMLETHKPLKLIIVGDLFHSSLNHEWELFSDLVKPLTDTEVILVRGNHDTFPAYMFKNSNIKVTFKYFLQPFEFSHHPVDNSMNYVISGHKHPGVLLKSTARQHLRLPCFYFDKKQAILPAFGGFTGLDLIEKTKQNRIFVITPEKVIEI